MSRIGKQLIYGTSYLAILALLVTGVYFAFFRSPVGCTNGRQDANEEGVDCGGACALVCLPSDLRAVSVDSATLFTPLPNRAAALVRIKNPNANLAARKFTYAINFVSVLNSGKQIAQTVTGESFAYAGEIKYLTAYIDTATLPKLANVTASVGNVVWARADDFRRPEIILQSRATTATDADVRVTGRIASRDTVTFPEVTVRAVFFGSVSSQPIGVSETTLESLSPGEARDFTVIHPIISGIDPAKTEVTIAAGRP